jgi:hypothetical protein
MGTPKLDGTERSVGAEVRQESDHGNALRSVQNSVLCYVQLLIEHHHDILRRFHQLTAASVSVTAAEILQTIRKDSRIHMLNRKTSRY